VLEMKNSPGEGDTVHFKRPRADGHLVLGERISRGKEGSVYAVEDEPNLVAKIFKKGKVTSHRKEKVELMVQRELWLPGISFPESELTCDDNFVGFTMRRAQDANVLNDTIFIPQELERLYPGWTRRDLVDICLSFLKRVKSLHELNIIIGDINPNNVMLGNQKDAWIIDMDSVQVDGYPCPVGWDEFTAPEILGGVQGLRTMEHENFAVAVMLFMIMMTGTFPYENSGSDDTIQNIKSGLFPYGFAGKSERDLQPPLRWLYVWSHLSRQLKGLFWNSFHKNGSRYQPDKRVSVEEWIDAFESFKKNLSYRHVDPQSLEIFPIRRKAERGAELLDCPKCGGKKFIAQNSAGEDLDKKFLTPSACNECLPNCESCGVPREPDALRGGLCWSCRGTDVEANERAKRGEDRLSAQEQRAARDAERARRESLDFNRLCERCGKPYITLGEIDWLTQRNIRIRPVHKRSDPMCIASPTPSVALRRSSSGSSAKSSAATAPQAATASQSESLWTRIVRWFEEW
jgi:serine/threonine protein kinase